MKLAVGPILAPYLIRGMSHDKAFAKIEVWLDRCESLRPKEPLAAFRGIDTGLSYAEICKGPYYRP